MLHDLDQTLENLIYTEGKLNKKEIDISFEQPTSEWSARLSRPTLNFWCFDLRENVKLRTMDRQYTRNGTTAKTTFPPRRMDLSYLVTAWARKVEDEHQLLWRALAVLKRFTNLVPAECEGILRYQTRDIPLTVADMTDNPINLVDLWSVMDNQMRLGFITVATVELDTEIGFEGPLVLEAFIRVGTAADPTRRHPELDGEYVEIQHKGDLERFEKTGEKKISTTYVKKHHEPEEDAEGDEKEE